MSVKDPFYTATHYVWLRRNSTYGAIGHRLSHSNAVVNATVATTQDESWNTLYWSKHPVSAKTSF